MISRNFVVILLAVFLVSCGGGSGSSDNQSANSSDNQSADGVWIGSVTHSNGISSEIAAISSGGEFIIIDADSEVILNGSLNIRGDKLSATRMNQYEFDGGYIMYFELDGVVNTKSKIMADVVDVASGDKSILNLDYQMLTDEPITYSDLSGAWYFQGDDDIYRLEDIDAMGAYAIEDDGCVSSGKFSIPNKEKIIVTTEFTVTGASRCPIGNYSGLGIMDGVEIFAVGLNNQYAIIQSFIKIDD